MSGKMNHAVEALAPFSFGGSDGFAQTIRLAHVDACVAEAPIHFLQAMQCRKAVGHHAVSCLGGGLQVGRADQQKLSFVVLDEPACEALPDAAESAGYEIGAATFERPVASRALLVEIK